MGLFDWLGNIDTTPMNPNFTNALAQAGSGFSQGQPLGQVLGNTAATYIQNSQQQGAIQTLLNMMAKPQGATPVSNAVQSVTAPVTNVQTSGIPTTNVQPWQAPQQELPSFIQQQPQQQADPLEAIKKLSATPKGTMGPDSITTNTTADGETITVKNPTLANVNSYGTSVPPEAVPKITLNGGPQSPFFQALLVFLPQVLFLSRQVL